MKTLTKSSQEFLGSLEFTSEYYYHLINGVYADFIYINSNPRFKNVEILNFIKEKGFKILQEKSNFYKRDIFDFESRKDLLGKANEEKRILFRSSNKKNSFLLRYCGFGDGSCSLDYAGSFSDKKKMQDISAELNNERFLIKKSQEISIITCQNSYIELKSVSLDPIEIDLDLNYGFNFKDTHEDILNKINSRKNGLYIFRGAPGTGKTSYIKYLSGLCNRKFAFIPITMINSLVEPSFANFLLENKDLVLILEDAEKAIISREENGSNTSLVSSILNLSDGILGSLLKTSIIITFNTSKEKIDEALMRKGRLLMDYEFKSLNKEESQKLIDKLGKKHIATEGMILSDIYNLEDKKFEIIENKIEKQIGFSIVK